MDFSEIIAATDLKVSRGRHLIEYMKICEYWRSRSFLDLGPRSYTYKTSNWIFSETTVLVWTKLCMKAFRYKEMKKSDDMMLVAWPRWPPRPYMVKTFENLLLKNRMSYDLETWHVALGTQTLQSLYKWWPWVDLELFYGKVKFGILGFSIGKVKTLDFRNFCSQWPESW